MKYEEIRVGDQIMVTSQREDVTRTVTGVVHSKRGGYLKTEKGIVMHHPYEGANTRIDLLDRPTPGLPAAGSWVRFQTTYDSEWKIGQVQTGSLVETLDNIYDQDKITEFEEISWIAVTEG